MCQHWSRVRYPWNHQFEWHSVLETWNHQFENVTLCAWTRQISCTIPLPHTSDRPGQMTTHLSWVFDYPCWWHYECLMNPQTTWFFYKSHVEALIVILQKTKPCDKFNTVSYNTRYWYQRKQQQWWQQKEEDSLGGQYATLRHRQLTEHLHQEQLTPMKSFNRKYSNQMTWMLYRMYSLEQLPC